MDDRQTADASLLSHFVGTLAQPLQEAVKQGTPPEVTESVLRTVHALDPELERAFQSGNPAIIQSVLKGASTTQMVVNDMICAGIVSGMPPGIQLLIDERLKDIREKQAAENDGLVRTATAAAAICFMPAPAAGMTAYGKEGGDRQPAALQDRSIDTMNTYEKEIYFRTLAGMSPDQWLNQSERQQRMDLDNNRTAAAGYMNAGNVAAGRIPQETEELLRASYAQQGLPQPEIDRKVKADMERYHDGIVMSDAVNKDGKLRYDNIDDVRTMHDSLRQRAEQEQNEILKRQMLKGIDSNELLIVGTLNTARAAGNQRDYEAATSTAPPDAGTRHEESGGDGAKPAATPSSPAKHKVATEVAKTARTNADLEVLHRKVQGQEQELTPAQEAALGKLISRSIQEMQSQANLGHNRSRPVEPDLAPDVNVADLQKALARLQTTTGGRLPGAIDPDADPAKPGMAGQRPA